MKNFLLIILLGISTLVHVHALIINEIMSNPVGDDGGREWVEIYNNSGNTVDLSTLTISVKGATPLTATNLSGGTSLAPNGYAIIASTVSGATKFNLDYPTFSGPLFKSTISLVNTGVTSLEIKTGGVSTDIVASYTAAKEGLTYSLVQGTFVSGTPTPGGENQIAQVIEDTNTQTTITTTGTQSTLPQAQAPSSDIVLYLPQEKTVVAGAESSFSVFALTRSGKTIDNLTHSWAYGDGGQGIGSTTMYRYAYPGKYIATVESSNGNVLGTGRINVRVVTPDISIKNISSGKYGAYIDIENPNAYELDLSQWKLTIDGVCFPFPKNTFLSGNNITHITGVAMGFASTTISSSTVIKILFPNQEEITRYTLSENSSVPPVSPTVAPTVQSKNLSKPTLVTYTSALKSKSVGRVLGVGTSSATTTKSNLRKENQKDTRIASFLKTFF